MKKKISGILCLITFVILLVIGIHTACTILYPINNITMNWLSFYKQERNSIDVLVVGNSHAFSTFNVDLLQDMTGKKYYNLASNTQNVTQTYYNLKEALKYQKPSLVILEASAIDSNDNWHWNQGDEYDKDWKKESNIDGMRFGLTKVEAICNQYEPKNWLYAGLKIARCHQYWRDTNQIKINYEFYKNGVNSYSSFTPALNEMSPEIQAQYLNAPYDDNPYYVSNTNREHFYKLVNLCKENNIPICIIMAPSLDSYINSINYDSMYEAINSLANEVNVPYLDCNLHYNEISLEPTDFEDVYNAYHHLNESGANKTTGFIIGWLESERLL